MGVENGMFRSEIGSGFEDTGGTPPPRIPRSTPPGVSDCVATKLAVKFEHGISLRGSAARQFNTEPPNNNNNVYLNTIKITAELMWSCI